jgi:hypothetical protein
MEKTKDTQKRGIGHGRRLERLEGIRGMFNA